MSGPVRNELLAALDVLEESDAATSPGDSPTSPGPGTVSLSSSGSIGTALIRRPASMNSLAENLLLQLPRESPARYRTRMSEAVRLFTHLRRCFPASLGSRAVAWFRTSVSSAGRGLSPSGTSDLRKSSRTCVIRNSPPPFSLRSSAPWLGGHCPASN